MIHNYTFEELTAHLHSMIPMKEWARVEKNAEIYPEFSCFADTYYHLSQIIPKDWVVIDFGAAYNAQSYFFTGHKKFIAVNPISIAGDKREKNVAAIITPAAKPSIASNTLLLIFLKRKTTDAPKAVIPQVKIVAINA